MWWWSSFCLQIPNNQTNRSRCMWGSCKLNREQSIGEKHCRQWQHKAEFWFPANKKETKRKQRRTNMEFSQDPYELKLFQMFNSCDSQQCGYLDEQSLRRLCGLLELRDKGKVLIDNLAAEGRTSHVTFENFKEALLNFLGTELDGGGGGSSLTTSEQSKSTDKAVVAATDGNVVGKSDCISSIFAIPSSTKLLDFHCLKYYVKSINTINWQR